MLSPPRRGGCKREGQGEQHHETFQKKFLDMTLLVGTRCHDQLLSELGHGQHLSAVVDQLLFELGHGQ